MTSGAENSEIIIKFLNIKLQGIRCRFCMATRIKILLGAMKLLYTVKYISCKSSAQAELSEWNNIQGFNI